MRVTHVIAPGPRAGAENVVLQGCSALVTRRHTLWLSVMVDRRCPRHGEELIAAAEAMDIPVRALDVRGRVDPVALLELRTELKSRKTEIIHAHGYKALAYVLLARDPKSPVVVTHHGDTGHDRLARFYEHLARTSYRWVDRVFSVSTATTETLVAAGVEQTKLRTVPNPVSLPVSSANGEHVPADGALLFVGRLSEEKGLDVLLRALASANASSQLRLDVAGDGPCAAEWKALSSNLGLEGRVRWLGVRSDVPELLAHAQALVLPSLREGLPLAVLEAASCEVPVVASRVGGVPEAVWEGESAVLVAPGDVDAWSKALESLPMQTEKLRAGARKRGREVRARHAPERWAELTTQYYREVAR